MTPYALTLELQPRQLQFDPPCGRLSALYLLHPQPTAIENDPHATPRRPRHLSQVSPRPRRPPRGAYRHAREGPRHLAGIQLGADARRGAGAGLRAGRQGPAARRQGGDHRRQPPAALLGHGGGAVRRRRAGAAVPGRRGRGNAVRPGACRNALRHRRGPGAGGQAAARQGALPEAGTDRVRRPARAAPLQRAVPVRLRGHPGGGA